MNDPGAALQRFGAALDSRDCEVVMACFAADASLDLMFGEQRITFTSRDIREAIDELLTGFDDIKLTPTTRQVSASRVVQESVLSGLHTGPFAGAQPTSGRIHVIVKLSATAAPDSTLQSLCVEADTRALFAQIAGNDDVIGMTGALMATARERRDGTVRVIDATRSPAAPAAHDGAPPRISRLRSRWAALALAGVLLIMGFLAWRPDNTHPALNARADHSTSRHAVAPSQPTPARSQETPMALPPIAIVAPKSTPKVQPGRQVVLNSDVLFGFDSAVLTPAARTALTRVAQQVRSAGVTGTIQVNGYTDNLGNVAYDLALSRARALAVARLLQTGLAGRPVTLAPQGLGQASPIAPNTSDLGRSRNRRVTIVLPTLH
jgi:outer membrane protein OmpA-like peptidoglycan-associated protein